MLTWWLLVALCAAGAAACPQHCSCFTDPDGYSSANCSTLALGAVQPSNLDLLSFLPHEPGYPTKLAPRAFLAFRKVKFLWVVNCSVLNLPNEVFQGLDLVIKMDLSYNKIRHLNGGVFKSLGSLHILLLRGNPLLLTPWDVIVSDSLQELDLGHCGLRTIPQGTFISVPRLSRLYLDGNEIHTFTFNMIPAGLRYLNLARNRIVNVPTDVLTTMSYLRKLDLSKNPIHCNCNLVIMQDWFSGQGIIFENGVTCSEPALYAGQHLNKINENELCTLEEVKRQRRINDIESYRDSKSHRADNMIPDPDLQSDQPGGELDSEVLFDDEGTRGLGTHMESKLYPPLPSDLSDENNKLASSKHELAPSHTVLPTQYEPVQKVSKEDILGEMTISNNTDTSDEISTEDLSTVNHESPIKSLTAESLTIMDHKSHVTDMAVNVTSHPSNNSAHLEDLVATDSPENEMADEGYSPLYSSTPKSHKNYTEFGQEHTSIQMGDGLSYDSGHNVSLIDSIMADEGYSTASHLNNSELEELGSGDDELEAHSPSQTPVSDKSESTTEASIFFRTSHIDSSDYTYDAQHDYSAETESTTESMKMTETDEGSGSSELIVDPGSTTLPPYINEDNETSTEYYTVENSTDIQTFSESSTETHASSSSDYTELPETTYSSSENIATVEQTEESTSEHSTEGTTIAVIYSSSESSDIPSSSEASISSSESMITTGIQSSSSSEPEVVITTTVLPSSSTEPSSVISQWNDSSEGPELSITTRGHSDTTKETTPTPEVSQTAESTTLAPVNEVEIISRINKKDQKEPMIEPTQAEREEGRTEAAQPSLNYIIAGLIVVLIVIIITAVVCKKVFRTGPCTSKKKVRLPQDTEAHLATEMQDMLLPKPPENGVKIIPQNGTQNGKEVKEEEIPVLQKDWDEKPEPIETVTARMSVIAGPQTPVFIHKTLA